MQTMTNEPSQPVKPASAANGNDSFHQQRELLHRQMLSAVSHDLKTPLASVIGSLEIFQRMGSKLSEEKRETLIETALGEAHRLDNFLTNILDMAKLEADQVPVRIEPSDIRALLETAVGSVSTRFGKASMSIHGAAHIMGNLDPALFSRVISLILDNAVKHAGAAAKIDITYRKNGDDRIIVEISDDGPGIPAGNEEAIFSKYTRLSRLDHQNAGTGLGLAIARLIAQKLRGRIRAQNQPQGGACFVFECAI